MRHGTAALVIALVVISWFATERLNSQTRADWDWTNKRFGSVLDVLMPLQSDRGVYVSYRANRDLYTNTPEYWFTIGIERDEKQQGSRPYLSAHVRVAQPISIYDQLMAIHRDDPAAQDTFLEKRVKLQSLDLTETKCPAIKVQLEKLKSLPLKLPNFTLDYIILHPMIHAFYINGMDGDARIMLTDTRNPLVRWAQDTRQMFDGCAKPH